MCSKNFTKVWIIVGLVWFNLPVRAEPADALRMRDCVRIALARHLLLQSSTQRHRAVVARVDQAGAVPPPSLAFDSDLQSKPFNFFGSKESYFGITQLFEFPGKRSVRKEIAYREADEAEIEIALLKSEVTYETQMSFYEVLLAEERLKYRREELKLSHEFLEHTRAQHESGEGTRVEVLRAMMEVSKAASALKFAENEVRLARARLNFRLGRPSNQKLQLVLEPRPSLSSFHLYELQEKALSARPELRRQKALVEKEKLRERQARLSKWPDLDLGFARHTLKGEQSTWDVTLAVPLPFLFGQPRKGEMAEARLNREALVAETEHLSNVVRLEVEEAYLNAQGADEQIRLIESQVLKQAEELHDLFLSSDEERENGCIEKIEARRNLLEARNLHAESIHAYLVSLALLEKCVGQTLTEVEREGQQ
ncbi:MAG TPA: TolC family protein [Acidobacteriota bacterium]|nr:TolC family protein [Acidobacteriota bacterium]